eukprot:gene4424-14556_t
MTTCLEHDGVEGMLIKAEAMHIGEDRLKASAATRAGDKKRRRISELDRDLAEQRRVVQDKGKEAERRRISDMERHLTELRRLLQDRGKEAEAAKRQVGSLKFELGALLVKADARQIEMERLRVAVAAATTTGGGNQQQREIQALKLAMEKQRRVLEGKVREAEAECSRLKFRLRCEAEVGGESISLALVVAEIQQAVASCPDPAAKKKMLKDLSMKWHPDKNPVMSALATEISKLINMFFRG